MKILKRGGRSRWLVSLALIGVPWFFRDQVASSLEEHTRQANQVLTDEDNQQQRQVQGSNQRQLMNRIGRIELHLQRAGAESDPEQVETEADSLWQHSIKAEGTALVSSVTTFNSLLDKIDMAAAKKDGLKEVAHQADSVGNELSTFDASAPQGKITDLLKNWGQADSALTAGYAVLSEAAAEDRDSSSSMATIARFVAWALTAIGALMIGDWKRMLRRPEAGEDDEKDGNPDDK